MKSKHIHTAPPARGVTLIELMVAIVIGLVVVLAATNILLVGERQKRTSTGTNDINQSGAFAAYSIDRVLRSAGSGFSQAWDQGIFGCKLGAARSGTAILPRTSTAFPVPFQGFLGGAGTAAAGNLRVAPVVIGKGQSAGGSDVLMVMSGNGAAGDIARHIRSGVTATNNLRLDNTVGLQNNDLGLVTQPGTADCLIQQVAVTDAAAFATVGNDVLPLGGTYLDTAGGALNTMAGSGNAFYSALGNESAGNVQLQLLGVDANRTLVAYDLLRSSATTANPDPIQPIADGVLEMHALYGIDTSTPRDNIVDDWVAPTGTWSAANVMADPLKIRQIVAVRVALVLRSSVYEKEDVAVERPALFTGATGAIAAAAYAASSDDRHFRLRVIDTTIPLRNMLLLPSP